MKDDLFYSELFERYLQDKCSPKEANTLFEYLQTRESDKVLLEKLRMEFLQAKPVERVHGDKVREELLARVTTGKVVGLRSRILYRRWWIAAAAVAVLVVGSLWFVVGRDKVGKSSIAVSTRVQQDIAPGGDKAVLTLADGSQVVLDTASNGALTKQGNVTVIKLNGKLAYQSAASNAIATVSYNTITTPRGGQYQLELADGSKVWLNAASSLRFPTAFTGKERRVELTGEGYFEVAHNAHQPFIVGIPPLGGNEGGEGLNVQVLGTHFNINAYSDEPMIKTTLLEGKVKVAKGKETVIIQPGEQAQARNVTLSPGERAPLTIDHSPDLESTVAWKNGYFSFHNADVQTVMRQLARWYNVTVEYKGAVPERVFEGEMQRDLVLSQALKILETNHVHFKMEGQKIIVMP